MNWYNSTTDIFMKRGYLSPKQTIQEKISEMSLHAENILQKPDFHIKMKEYLEKGYYIVPTPVWKNFNPISKESAISCFGVFIGDTVESILLKAGEVGMQNKIGGGSSGYFGSIRPRGSQIGVEGKSNGSVSMMEIYQTISDIISQPNRRGHFSATQDIEHFDIDEFLRIRSEGHPIQDLSFSVSIGDDFMRRVLTEDAEAVEIIRKIVKCRFETGFPYIFFKDNVNNNTVDVYKDKGKRIMHSNMCVTKDQLVVTSNGLKTVEDLVNSGEDLILFDGDKEVKASPMRLIEKDVSVYKITTKSGRTHTITDYHKVMTERGMIECKDLTIKDRVSIQKKKGLFGSNVEIEKAFLLGLYQKDEANKLGFKKGYIPKWLLESTEETQWSYIKGLFIADGSATLKSDNLYLTLTSADNSFLKELQILLSNLGISSNIYSHTKKGKRKLPDCKESFRLKINSKNDALIFEHNTGFLSRKGVNLENKVYKDNTQNFDKIIAIEQLPNEDVYCTTVNSEEHLWVCNSFITSNCHEIMLPNNEGETFVCNLLGMNIEKFDEWRHTDAIEVGIYFMDAMLTDFIDKNRDSFFMKPAVKFAERHRAMGMGASGYHNYLQSKSIPFSSMEAKFTNTDIFKTIKNQAYMASEKMALEYGKPKMLKEDKYKRRHTTLLAVAPNTSSSFIMEQQSQSIEPHVSNYYIKDVAKTRITVKNKHLEALLDKLGKNTDDVWSSILKKSGSVQHLDFLSAHDKKVFETFGEISQMEILLQASTRQKFIDQSQSLNLMVPSNSTPADVAYLIIKAWQLGIKTLYYQLNVSAVQEFGKSITECESCSG